jgi:hypothetical protein
MSNDIKLAAKGALAGAAGSSAGDNIAQVFRPEAVDFSRPASLPRIRLGRSKGPDAGGGNRRVFRAFRVSGFGSPIDSTGVLTSDPASLSGGGEAFEFPPQLAVPEVSEERKTSSHAPIKLNILTETGSHSELPVTYSKQTTAPFLTGTRIDQYRIAAVTRNPVSSRCRASANRPILTGSDTQTEFSVTHSKKKDGAISTRGQN